MAKGLFTLWGARAPKTATAPAVLATGLNPSASSEGDEEAAAASAEDDEDDEGEGAAAAGGEGAGAASDDDEEDAEEDDEEDDDDDDDDDDDEEDKEAAKAAAKVPAKAAGYIRRAERSRIHAIVDGAGPDRVAEAMHVALNTKMNAKTALAFLKASPVASMAGGKLGLQGAMGGRRQPPLAPAAGQSAKSEVDQAAAGILAFASNRGAAK